MKQVGTVIILCLVVAHSIHVRKYNINPNYILSPSTKNKQEINKLLKNIPTFCCDVINYSNKCKFLLYIDRWNFVSTTLVKYSL